MDTLSYYTNFGRSLVFQIHLASFEPHQYASTHTPLGIITMHDANNQHTPVLGRQGSPKDQDPTFYYLRLMSCFVIIGVMYCTFRIVLG
jgi:hypothetical protein